VAATIAAGAPAAPARQLAWMRPADRYPLKRLFSDVPLADKLPLVQGVNERCFALSKLVAKVSAQFHDQQKRILVVTSDGTKAEDLQPRSYLAAFVVAEKDGRKEQAGWNLGGRRDISFFTPATVEAVAARAVDDAVRLFDAVQPPAGEMPVVLGPGVTAVLLHEAIGHGMDDGTIPGMLGSINFDDEGVPGQRTLLVEDGILRSYMHDRISARHYGVKPTGNGRRESYQHYVQPRMRNTLMLAGPADPAEVVRAAGKGIYVQNVSNGQVKIGEGDFAFYVAQGRLIEDGRLGAPIKDVNIMGNGPKMLRNIVMVGHDLEMSQGGTGACGKGGQAVPVGFGQPTCLVKSLTVGGVR
jgi:TldD protein